MGESDYELRFESYPLNNYAFYIVSETPEKGVFIMVTFYIYTHTHKYTHAHWHEIHMILYHKNAYV